MPISLKDAPSEATEKERRKEEITAAEGVLKIGWGGSSRVSDPVRYFRGNERVQQHLTFVNWLQGELRRSKERPVASPAKE